MEKSEHKNLFQRAMRHWENHTCVSFVPKLDHHKHYIMFTIDKCGYVLGKKSIFE
ncbi:unnamed protein product [Nippostrongylus brasiliensis]|uniref:Astacin domain-containing protein n=1 Tax=Nippostrongylus brasiliensis TaxID=27835 RepID=A0A0N4YYR5_NIPBR|nr:unnamed protein product [Nippostrongylus brasiliensis]